MRSTERANNEIRQIEILRNYTKHAEGSVLIKCGDTHVICNASVEEKVPSFLKGKGQGWVTAEYGMLPRSTSTRMSRESARGKQSGRDAGLTLAYPERRASHEFILTFGALEKRTGLTAMDLAKRLLDFGVHAPTTYFPLLVPECWLVEPTETETKETLDHFVAVLQRLLEEVDSNPEQIRGAPWTLPVRRLDDVRAARQLDLVWQGPPAAA